MNYIRVTKENIKDEHICCAISNNNDIQVSSKKAWMNKLFDDGLVFVKSELRGKCFIEYIPAINSWNPVIAPNYMFINCLWVSGSLKGNGYSNDLLQYAINDAKEQNKDGLCILSSTKKKPFLSDPKYLFHKGFKVACKTSNDILLMYLPFNDAALIPSFSKCVTNHIDCDGFVLYYTHQCPFNAKYVPILEDVAKSYNIKFTTIFVNNKEQAQNLPTPITNYALFYNGDYLTNEQMNDARFIKLLNKLGLINC